MLKLTFTGHALQSIDNRLPSSEYPH